MILPSTHAPGLPAAVLGAVLGPAADGLGVAVEPEQAPMAIAATRANAPTRRVVVSVTVSFLLGSRDVAPRDRSGGPSGWPGRQGSSVSLA